MVKKIKNIVTKENYYISPKVKDIETSYACPEDLSLDYKRELMDALAEKHL